MLPNAASISAHLFYAYISMHMSKIECLLNNPILDHSKNWAPPQKKKQNQKTFNNIARNLENIPCYIFLIPSPFWLYLKFICITLSFLASP